MVNQIEKELKIKIKKQYDLVNDNSFKLHCICDYFVKPNSVNCLIKLINILKNNNQSFYIIGNGSNIVINTNHYHGWIIKLSKLNKIDIKDNLVIGEAGVNLNLLVKTCLENNLTGLEWAFGIPGNIGGSINGNAGAFNQEIFDNIKSVTYLDESLNIVTKKRNSIKFSYRDSEFKNNKHIIIKASWVLKKDDKNISWNLIKDRQQRRKMTQPLEYPSAGSVFRNPPNDYAGRLIEELGLKGYNINSAFVSEKHANFIINKNNACGEDIIALITLIKQKIKEKYNIDLIVEQNIMKWE